MLKNMRETKRQCLVGNKRRKENGPRGKVNAIDRRGSVVCTLVALIWPTHSISNLKNYLLKNNNHFIIFLKHILW